jgi:hypothetical protein
MSSRATGLICCCCMLLCLVSATTARVLIEQPLLLRGEVMLRSWGCHSAACFAVGENLPWQSD